MLEDLLVVKALLEKGLAPEQVAQELGVTARWVEMVTQVDGFQLVASKSAEGPADL